MNETMSKEELVRELFLKIFAEEGISKEELKEAICQSYIDEGFKCKTFDEIPMLEIETTIIDCYAAGGLEFENIDAVLEHNKKED